MIPEEVLIDPRLSHRDIRVYCVLTCARRGQRVKMGQRLMADRALLNRRALRSSLQRLIEFGMVEKLPREGKERARYLLTDPLFTGKASTKPEPLEEGPPVPAANKPVPPRVACAVCQVPRARVSKSGVCPVCSRQARTDARVAAIVSADPAITDDQVYVRAKLESNRGVQEAIRRARAS